MLCTVNNTTHNTFFTSSHGLVRKYAWTSRPKHHLCSILYIKSIMIFEFHEKDLLVKWFQKPVLVRLYKFYLKVITCFSNILCKFMVQLQKTPKSMFAIFDNPCSDQHKSQKMHKSLFFFKLEIPQGHWLFHVYMYACRVQSVVASFRRIIRKSDRLDYWSKREWRAGGMFAK